MKAKVLLIIAVLFASLFIFAVTPVEAELTPDDFTMTTYDPTDDVIRIRTGGAFLFAQHNNIDITKMTSSYIDNPVLDQIELSMTVTGTIQSSDYYRYGFGVVTEDGEYVIGYTGGAAVGFELHSSTTFVVTPTAQGNTLKLRFNVAGIGNPQNKFEFKGGATYSKDAYERFIDFGPDKLILITEPSDGSTVNGDITIKGVILESIENKPSGDVKIKIDNGVWQDVTVNDPYWSFPLDTTTLTEDQDHTISVKVEGETLGIVEDEITIYVDQSTGDYEPLNEIPQVHKGDWYEYISMGDASIVGIPIEVTNQMTTEIEDIETITMGGTSYETYVMKSHTEGEKDLGYAEYSQKNDRWSWRKKDDFSTVQERTISTVEVEPRPETTVDAMTTYSPSLETHNFFDFTVGFNIGANDNRWTFGTTAETESTTSVSGGDPTPNPDYGDNLNIIGECLYYLPNINVRGNTFEDIFVIRTYYENPGYDNPGVSVLEYYSKELGVPVQIDTFDTSRNLMFSLGLDDWKQVPYSIDIEDITFDPSPPKAEKNNKIIIGVKNEGDEAAQNVKITVMDGNIEVAQETITSIAAGATEDLTIDWKPSDEGNHSIRIIASYQNDDLDDETYYVDVDPPDEDTGFNILFLIIIVIVVIIIILAVVLLKRRGAEAPEGEEAEAAEEPTEAAAPAQAAAPVKVGAEPEVATTPQAESEGITENIVCPSCKQTFSVSYESKPVRVKCPNCGTEGVLR